MPNDVRSRLDPRECACGGFARSQLTEKIAKAALPILRKDRHTADLLVPGLWDALMALQLHEAGK